MTKNLSCRSKIAVCVSLGLLLNQFFHTLAYWQAGTSHVAGFPNLQIPTYLAFVFSVLIFVISIAIFLVSFRKVSIKPYRILYLLLILGILSQIFSRGLVKAGFDGLLMGIIYMNLLIEKTYTLGDAFNLNYGVLTLLHTELSSLLKISVGVFIFIWSAVGITFAVQFLQRYYESPLRSDIMVWYGVMIIYLGLCFALFVSYVLFNKMVAVRNIYKDKVQRKE